ncbi:tRNA (guanine-N(1)-)-methyltransferase [Thermodesulfobacterium geofontis OPF15]|jgi:tRNA (guanine37-N1)-methyltransferase|uniref:tRNA (guanine-N(1)-)-methyltransferase n=1 Tax=Thermodesulfobacterium geofontis (strain OPF15) TaxID=795359 RepID=F8C544_THEGP|nr:tRNA (guanosine(37)-N1)-methyltransferase TrmD [Thermodesulfobacterium geofontis]AEH22811.1 tRNA (guanine-N(1)-)-methyltransferase [Thermodesulfobacterium geofontis OPF15]
MQIDVITIFPEYFESPLKIGLLGKALKKGIIKINLYNLRDFTEDKHKVVDDAPFGGGEGMVFKPEPLYKAISHIKNLDPSAWIIYLSPQGEVLNQKIAERLSKKEHLVLICGRYEGIDERIRANFIDEEISIGDYVVFGGEVASLVLIETLARLIPGVVGKKDSVEKESFSTGLLKYPCYTRPRNFMGYEVPEILLSGNHAEIEKYRRKLSLEITLKRKPYLFKSVELTEEDRKFLAELLKSQRLYIFLVHYPVFNKKGEKIASAITNLDLHDLSRLARTYGVKGVFIIQPLEDQRKLAEELIEYWLNKKGAQYNPLRKSAIELIKLFETLDSAISEVEKIEGEKPVLLGTDASPKRKYISCEEVRKILWEKPVVLVLGTAWGLCDEVLDRCDYFLEPIWGRLDPYNHLSVRSAASIFIDRILGIYSFYKK